MAKTHELGLSFKTIGSIPFAILKAGDYLQNKKWFEQPVFWHTIKVKPGTPLHSRAYSGEIDGEYRHSNSHVFRLPFGRALVVGSWQPKPEELDDTDMLLRATNLDHERADEQSTEFDASVVGLQSEPPEYSLPLTPPTGNESTCCGGGCC